MEGEGLPFDSGLPRVGSRVRRGASPGRSSRLSGSRFVRAIMTRRILGCKICRSRLWPWEGIRADTDWRRWSSTTEMRRWLRPTEPTIAAWCADGPWTQWGGARNGRKDRKSRGGAWLRSVRIRI